MKVQRWNGQRDGPFSEQALRRRLTDLGYSVGRYEYPLGTSFGAHAHAVDKIDAVLSGHFRISMENDAAVLGPGDYVFVPRGTQHTAEVVGEEPVVSLDAIRIR